MFLDHPLQRLVPRFPIQALLLDDGQRVASLAEAKDQLATRAGGQSLPEFFVRRRCRRGERSPASQRGRDDRGQEEQPLQSQDAYTEIRCIELFM